MLGDGAGQGFGPCARTQLAADRVKMEPDGAQRDPCLARDGGIGQAATGQGQDLDRKSVV